MTYRRLWDGERSEKRTKMNREELIQTHLEQSAQVKKLVAESCAPDITRAIDVITKALFKVATNL